jgi:hypothetical protein
MRALLAILFVAAMGAVRAEIPAAYGPVVLEPAAGSGAEQVFDLSVPLELARTQHKRLFVYLGAPECSACRSYTLFLREHERELRPLLERFVVVDLRSSLRARRPAFVVMGRRYSTSEFKELIGDRDPDLPYPTWWLLTPAPREVRQLPRGVNHFVDLKSHEQWLAEP